ncbi:hypothetical protein HY382_03090 [Candidatus Curtissbacteria bacterium]|nr:hypothetical protein [Candidatus Curtissbacteria bacterium]
MRREEFEQIKSIYLNMQPSPALSEGGWLELVGKLNKKPRRFFPIFFRLVLTSFVMLILAGAGLVKLSQASVPGDALYSVKRLSEDLVVEITGDVKKKVEFRANEVLKVAGEKDEETLKKATDEYKKAVEEASSKTRDEEKEQLKENLRNQGIRFEESKRSNPDLSDKLEKAIEAAKKGSGEIKGDKDRKGKEDKKGNESGNDGHKSGESDSGDD